MTKDQALKKAAVQFDRIYNDSIRKLVTDMCVAGRDDDEIAEAVAVAVEQHDEQRAAFLRQCSADIDEAVAYFSAEPPVTH